MPVDEEIITKGHGLRRHAGDAGRTAFNAILHSQQPVRNTNELADEQSTRGERLADAVANGAGSWRFIITQSAVLAIWVILNLVGWAHRWDPYPFILLNLALSSQAAYAAPIIMMSQNRQAAKDRLRGEEDYRINLRAEREVAAIQTRLDDLAGQQWDTLLTMQREQMDILARIEGLTTEVHRISVRLAVPQGSLDSLSPPP